VPKRKNRHQRQNLPRNIEMTESTNTAFTTLISAAELQSLQATNAPLMVFDCSFDLMKPTAGYESYLESHIAGAVYANLDTNLSAKNDPTAMSGGRHPLPTRERFAEWLASIGFTQDMQAVVYDRQGTMVAGRLWWMLKWLGHNNVAVLDGGFPAWQALQGSIHAGSEPALPTSQYACGLVDASLVELVDANAVAQHIGSQTTAILDARANPRFKGEVEPLDPVAGHIPSALNRPFNSNMNADGAFKSKDTLKAEFDALVAGRDPAQTVHHCGSGVSAIPNILAMTVAGYGMTTLYAGSWSDWCSDASRPVAQG
jgi:thiosulfate/3-mercaptopyruvate sulfurtransferase